MNFRHYNSKMNYSLIWIFQIMWLISLNLAFKINNLAIFFIDATIATIVATIIVSKILLSSQQYRDKPKSICRAGQ